MANTEVIELGQEVISYDNSLFTNAHDLVSLAPARDGRGTFSHLGVNILNLKPVTRCLRVNVLLVKIPRSFAFRHSKKYVKNPPLTPPLPPSPLPHHGYCIVSRMK